MAGQVIVRNDFRALMADGLRLLFDDYTQTLDEEFTGLFHMETSEKAFETELGFVGMGSPYANAELEQPRMDAPRQGRPVTYVMSKFALGVAMSYESRDDDRYGKISRAIVPELAQSFKRERNTQAANLLNNAFSYQGYEPDGVALCSASHPLVRGGVSSNLVTTSLSIAGLQTARARLRKTLSESGKIMPLIAETLITGPSYESLAEELTLSAMKPGQSGSGSGLVTQPNEVNLPFIKKLSVQIWNYLQDDGTYFVVASKSTHKIKWYDRKKLYNQTVIDDETESVKMFARARWALGFSDWRGIVGHNGP